MVSFFQSRNYPLKVIMDGLHRAKGIGRPNSLKPSSKSPCERPILVLPFHPHNLPLKSLVLKHWSILSRDPLVGEYFPDPPLVAYQRHKNLRDMLVHSKLRSSSSKPGTAPCNTPRCLVCPFIDSINTVRGHNKHFTVNRSFTCTSTNLVYVIRCARCNILYVGETGRAFSVRIKEHLADIRHERESRQVASHFLSEHHSMTDFRTQVLWGVHGDLLDRRNLESWLIDHLGTMDPHGLNRKA